MNAVSIEEELAVVIPVLNEQSSSPDLIAQIRETCGSLIRSFETASRLADMATSALIFLAAVIINQFERSGTERR